MYWYSSSLLPSSPIISLMRFTPSPELKFDAPLTSSRDRLSFAWIGLRRALSEARPRLDPGPSARDGDDLIRGGGDEARAAPRVSRGRQISGRRVLRVGECDRGSPWESRATPCRGTPRGVVGTSPRLQPAHARPRDASSRRVRVRRAASFTRRVFFRVESRSETEGRLSRHPRRRGVRAGRAAGRRRGARLRVRSARCGEPARPPPRAREERVSPPPPPRPWRRPRSDGASPRIACGALSRRTSPTFWTRCEW